MNLLLFILIIFSELGSINIVVIACVFILAIFILKRGWLKNGLRSLWEFVVIIFCGLFVGLANFSNVGQHDLARDLLLVTQPIIFILLGRYFYLISTSLDFNIFNPLFLAGTILGIRKIVLVLLAVLSGNSNYETIRSAGELSSGAVLVCVILIIMRQRGFVTGFLDKFYWLLSGVIVISFFLYFSRTGLLTVIPALIFRIFSNSAALKNIKFYILLVLLFLGGYFIIPQEILRQFLSKLGNSFLEVFPKNQVWTWELINSNWRAYESYRVDQVFKVSTSLTKVVGNGFGSLLYLGGFTIQLGDSFYSSIPTLHNGYSYLLFKTGILGCGSYLFFFLRQIIVSMKSATPFYSKLLIVLCIAAMSTMFVVTGLLNGAFSFSVSIMLGFCMSAVKKSEDIE